MLLTVLGCHLFASAHIDDCGSATCSADDTAVPTLGWDCLVWEEDLDGDLGVVSDLVAVCGTFEQGEGQETLTLSSAHSSTWHATVLVEQHYVGEIWLEGDEAEPDEDLTFDATVGEELELHLVANGAPLDWQLVLLPSR